MNYIFGVKGKCSFLKMHEITSTYFMTFNSLVLLAYLFRRNRSNQSFSMIPTSRHDRGPSEPKDHGTITKSFIQHPF